MTNQIDFKKRARLAYTVGNMTKLAENKPYNDKDHPAMTSEQIFAAQEANAEDGKRFAEVLRQAKTPEGVSPEYDDYLISLAQKGRGALPEELYPAARAALSRWKDAHPVTPAPAADGDKGGDKGNTPVNWGAVGAGALAGTGIAAGTYGLLNLFPSLRQRRLLNALISLGVGAAGGTAVGMGVNNGSFQKAYDWAKGKLS